MAADPFIGFELLPDEGAEVATDDELEAALGNPPVAVEEESDEKIPLGRGWAFDFERGQFVLHGNAPAGVSGLDQLRVWIEKALRTARFEHPVYSDDFGMERPFEMIGRQFAPALVAAYASSIEATLLVHDRITAVREFAFNFEDDTLFVSFEVVTDTGDTVPFDQIGF